MQIAHKEFASDDTGVADLRIAASRIDAEHRAPSPGSMVDGNVFSVSPTSVVSDVWVPGSESFLQHLKLLRMPQHQSEREREREPSLD